MSVENSEFAAVAISDDRLEPWPKVAAVTILLGFSLPVFITGLEIYTASTPADTAWALLIGSLIIFTIGTVMGVIGARTRMSSYLLVRIAFGDKGAGLVNLAFAISLLGWFGVNINIFAEAVTRLSAALFGVTAWPVLVAIIASVCMTTTTLFGFKAINKLAIAMSPILVIVTLLLIASALRSQSFAELLAIEKPATLSLGGGVSAVVGAIIVGAIILPDITRFVRNWRGVINIVFIAYFFVQILVMGAAGLAGAASGETEILDVMLSLGMGLGAFAIVIAGSWVLNSLNLYSAVLSIQATFPRFNSRLVTVLLGAVGVVAALMNILDYFVIFLIYLSIIFIPVAGVIMTDYLLIRPEAYTLETLSQNRQINPKGFLAWTAGALIAVLVEQGVFQPISGISAVDAIALSATVYAALSWNERGRAAHAHRN